MSDWRKIETAIVEFLKQGPGRPYRHIGVPDQLAGEWVLPIGNGRINLSALARELAAEFSS